MRKWLLPLALAAGLTTTAGLAQTQVNRVTTKAATSSQWLKSLDISGNTAIFTATQPQFTDIANVATQLFGTANTWTANQAFSTTTASRSVNTTSSNSLLSANLGPAGLALWPYDGFAAINYQNYVDSSSHVGASFATAGTFTTFTGSTANGPANSNVGHMFGCKKLNYLSSSVEGETDCIYLGVQQGAKGDASAVTGGVDKVQGSGSDTGAALAFEFSTRWVNSSGVVQKDMHVLGGFQESAGGVSNGGGYGYYAEAWKGAQFAAYFAGTYDGYTSTHTWDYVTYATYDRATANRYFAVRGNGSLSGSQQAGEILQGVGSNSKILRTNSDGSFAIRNAADSADVFKVTDAGAATVQTLATSAPITKTANYTVDSGSTKDSNIIFNGAGSLTVTLPSAASFTGRIIRIKTIAAQTVVSASSNVVPLAGGAAGTAILAATAGKWADLQSDGSNWIIMASN